MKSKSTAAILALLLGGIGIHKFYLDRPGQGVMYIVFCWTFIPAIFGFFEGLHYAFMSQENFRASYLPNSDEPSAQTHVRCPDCRELVRNDARKCKHCGCNLIPQ